MKKPFENWKERVKNLPTLRFEAVDEHAPTARMNLSDNGIRITIPSESAPGPNPGSITNDYSRYTEFDELGVGGTGVVHSCTDPHLNRKVALKVLRYENAHDQDQRTRFVREARIMAQLEHPNILPVHELGVRPNGTLYYSMKQINGKTLRDILNGLISEDPIITTAFPLQQLLDTFQHVCHAMAFAHSRGVMHRDLKPENILIGPFGEVLVMDWGLAKLVGEDDVHVSRHSIEELDRHLGLKAGITTIDGEVSGTPFYMAPEQAMGKSAEMDQRTDIYSLGVIFYEILTLERPIGGDTIQEVLDQVIQGNVSPPLQATPERNIPPELDAICMKAMAKAPGDRYDDLSQVIGDLENFESGKEVSVYRGDILRRTWKWCKRHPIGSSTSVASLAAILITVSALGLMRHVRLTDFRDAGDRELKIAERVYTLLQTNLLALKEIQRTETDKAISTEEAKAIKTVNELETQLITHLRNAEYLYTKARIRTDGNVPERLLTAYRLRVEYLINKKDFEGLARHLAYVKESILPLLDDTTSNNEIVNRVLKISEGRGSLSATIPVNHYVSLWRYQADDSNILKAVFVESYKNKALSDIDIIKGSYLLVISSTDPDFNTTSVLPAVPAPDVIYYPVNIDHSETESVTVKHPGHIPEGMLYVPAGTAYIGGVHSRNLRLHEQNIPGFFMKQFEVTFAEYLDFWLAIDGANRAPWHTARVRFDRASYNYEDAWDRDGNLLPLLQGNRPVVGISYPSAQAYCNWVSQAYNRPVRLPSAAEWEKAARGVDGRPLVWGTSTAKTLCYTLENSEARNQHGTWAPPGSFSNDVSVYGIYDLAGNVREWTSSTFLNSPYFQIKGGSSSLPQRFSYSSYSSDTPVVPSDVGFRYIMPIAEEPANGPR